MFLTNIAQNHEGPIASTLAQSLWRLSEDLLFSCHDWKTLRPSLGDRKACKRVLEKFRKYAHALQEIVRARRMGNPEYYVTIGILYELRRDYEKAVTHFSEAIRGLGEITFISPADRAARIAKWTVHLVRAQQKHSREPK